MLSTINFNQQAPIFHGKVILKTTLLNQEGHLESAVEKIKTNKVTDNIVGNFVSGLRTRYQNQFSNVKRLNDVDTLAFRKLMQMITGKELSRINPERNDCYCTFGLKVNKDETFEGGINFGENRNFYKSGDKTTFVEYIM